MSADFFEAELGFAIASEDGDRLVAQLAGAGAPGTTTQEDNAPIGSIYQRTDNAGEFYRKISAGAGTATWLRMADNNDILGISFRSELVRALTGDVAPSEGGVIDATAFGDDDAPALSGSDFAVGEYILFGDGGTPVLGEISNIASDDLTITYLGFDALADNDKFVVRNYLPDSPDSQEKQAIVLYNGTALIKLADVNFEFADGISLNTPFTPANGTVAAGDTVQLAIEKLVGNQVDLTTLTGVGQGAVDLGTFTGITIPDNVTIKAALQALETYAESLATLTETTASAVTSAITLDSVLADDVCAAQWLVTASLDSNPARRRSFVVFGHHNGTASADATATDEAIYARLRNGAFFNITADVDISGAGAAQVMRLRISAAAAISVSATRIKVPCA